MKKVLVNEKVSPDALDILKKAAEVVYIPSGDHNEIIKMLKDISGIMLDTTIKFTKTHWFPLEWREIQQNFRNLWYR